MQLATIEGLKLENRTSKSGSNLGQRIAFNREGTPSQMRAAYKAAGLKGNALSTAVRDAVKAGKDIAWVSAHALMQMAQNGEFIPAVGDINSKGNKLVLKFEKPSEPKAKKSDAPALPDVDPEQVIADRMGIAVESLRKLFVK